ncbi:MAG: SPOR domain-containing protein [Magnetococcales bacterium]|nr:SPOR domain-containing protein [Magnetococcales bacterium]
MKASPNREQQLFLITGGVILLLILAVVIFNMVRSPAQNASEEVKKRPMVKLMTENSSRMGSFSGRSSVGTAPIFSNQANEGGLNTEDVGTRTVLKPGEQLPVPSNNGPGHVLGGQTPDERLVGGWNRSPADLEAARLENNQKLVAAKKKVEPPHAPSAKLTPKGEQANQSADFSKAIANVVSQQQKTRQAAQQEADERQTAQQEAKARLAAQQEAQARLAAQQEAQALLLAQQEAQRQLDLAAKPMPATAIQPKPTLRPPTPTVTASSGYSVQIASLSSPERAQALENRLRAFLIDGKRMPVYQGTANVNARTFYRVRLGPFPSRSKAEQAERLIRTKMGMQGKLIQPAN